METARSPHGVPSGNGADGRTPHSQRQLMLSANVQGGTFWFKINGEERRAYVAFPQTDSPHAVVHTHADRKTPYKWESEERFREMIAPRLKPWYPTEDEREELTKAESGDYDREAEKQGYDSPFSYVLKQMREREVVSS